MPAGERRELGLGRLPGAARGLFELLEAAQPFGCRERVVELLVQLLEVDADDLVLLRRVVAHRELRQPAACRTQRRDRAAARLAERDGVVETPRRSDHLIDVVVGDEQLHQLQQQHASHRQEQLGANAHPFS